jgi:hypothetical protein
LVVPQERLRRIVPRVIYVTGWPLYTDSIIILWGIYSNKKRPLGRPRRGWVDNIRMDLGEVGWGDVDWICLAKDRNRWRALVNSVLNLRVP